MAASYNSGGVDGLPVISLATDGLLVSARSGVRTTPPVRSVEQLVQAIPGLAGHTATSFGVRAAAIVWDVWLEATSLANLNAFLAKLRQYENRSKGYRLVSEWDTGDYWDEVVPSVDRPFWEEITDAMGTRVQLGNGNWVLTARINWTWLKP